MDRMSARYWQHPQTLETLTFQMTFATGITDMRLTVSVTVQARKIETVSHHPVFDLL